MSKVLAWHFLAADGTTRGNTKPELGGVERHNGPLELCDSGLHGSRRLLDALKWARGPILRLVTLSGERILGGDKLVASVREEHWRMDVSGVLHEFACREAEDALRAAGVTDERCWGVVAVKRRWVKGEATDEELFAARAAVRDAARGAARIAARPAAWNAAGSVAWHAAKSAARIAAWGAWDVAWEATKKRQNCRLTAMVAAARKKEGKK
jgi:hypothetical protein